MNKSESIASLAAALAKFQGEVENPKNTAVNPQFRSKYAPLDVVINTIKPILAKHGLSFVQSTGSEGENIIITTMLLHESGEWIETDPLILPAYQLKSGGVKDFNAQGAGSGISYGRRYSLAAAIGVSSQDDDDGNAVSGGGTQVAEKQATNIKDKVAAATTKPPVAEAPPVVGGTVPDSLQEKYKQGKGNLDGLEKWVGDQMAKGRTYSQMEEALQAGLDKTGRK